MTELPLILKYRPISWGEVSGHKEQIAPLRKALASPARPHSILFTGPSGTGKTTLARIVAHELQAEINELNAAANNGIDAMRMLIEMGEHAGFGVTGVRAFIIDECHQLTAAAWNSILKMIEEPPAHLYILLCTTEPAKVIETVMTRCYHVQLRPLSIPQMQDYLAEISELEDWQVSGDVMQAVVQHAGGSPRKALTALQAVHDAPNQDEVRRILRLQDASDPTIALVQGIINGKGRNWRSVQHYLKKIDDDQWDQLLIGMGRYIAQVMITTEDEKQARWLHDLLEAIVYPAQTFDRKIAFMAIIGRLVFAETK